MRGTFLLIPQTSALYAVPASVGRATDVQVRLDDRTVSRHHALIEELDGQIRLRNLSASNPTKVNGEQVKEGAVALKDADLLHFGNVEAVFNDLSAGDRISGPTCSHCGRENLSTDRDCWFCGTSLVNAPTTILQNRRVTLRLAADDRKNYDLHEGEELALYEGSEPEAKMEGSQPDSAVLVVGVRDGRPQVVRASDSVATLNDLPAREGQALSNGCVLVLDGRRFVLIQRG